MPGIRADRFLATTAVFLVLSAAAGGALADPQSTDAAQTRLSRRIATAPRLPRPDAAKMPPPRERPDPGRQGTPAPAAAAPARPQRRSRPTPPPRQRRDAPAAPPPPQRPPPPHPRQRRRADAPIADQLHNLASGGFDRIIGNKKDRTEIDAFYAAPQLRAALDHRRQGQRARHRGDRLSRPCRCRRARSRRLSGAEFRRRDDCRPISPTPRSS